MLDPHSTAADTGCDPQPAAAAPARRRYFWTTGEDAILRTVYPRDGAQAALAALPGRTLRSVMARAHSLGLTSGARQGGDTTRRQFPQCDRIDEALRLRIPTCTARGQLEALAVAVGRPAWWVYRRAVALGLVYPRRKRDVWTPAEDAILAAAPHLGTRTLQRRLKAAGHQRSEVAVAVRLRRLRLSVVEPDTFTTGELAPLMGVSETTVRGWITREGLPARTTPGSQAARPQYRIRVQQLRQWVASHAQLVDLRRVDRFWFIDLAFGKFERSGQ